ncbi:hypothetical protein ACPCXF_17045 [Lysinibacillus agricola]
MDKTLQLAHVTNYGIDEILFSITDFEVYENIVMTRFIMHRKKPARNRIEVPFGDKNMMSNDVYFSSKVPYKIAI